MSNLAEVPMATMVAAHPGNYGHIVRPNWDLIVIHCTDGQSRAAPVAEMFATFDPKHPRSAHFVVDQDGSVIQCVPLRFPAYHAHRANQWSVGIEHCARTPGERGSRDPGLPPSNALYAGSARLVAWLLVSGGFVASRAIIKGHSEADATTTHTRCPLGCGWDWPRYMGEVDAAINALRGSGQ